MKILKLLSKIRNCIIVGLLIFMALPVFGAEIFFDSKTPTITSGAQFQVDLLLNTENKSINAVEGKVIFPSEILELKEIKSGNSIINFWVNKPKIKQNGQVIFSGITPGGYKGKSGLLFSLIFLAKNQGQGTLEVNNARTLLNDGKGTEAPLSIFSYQFNISQEVENQTPPPNINGNLILNNLPDTEPPEAFVPKIARNPSIFGNKWFLIFETQDKGSGIDHYEVKEVRHPSFGIFSNWVQAGSPYMPSASPLLLKDQELRSYIFVKALDKAGNEKIAMLSPKNSLPWYENYDNWLILIIIIVIILIVSIVTIRLLLKRAKISRKYIRKKD